MSESAEPLIPLPPDEAPASTVSVHVVVSEDGEAVDSFGIVYYRGQDYRVEIVTPDGTDRETRGLKAGVS